MERETTTTINDVWASGEAYEPYVGRWSRRVAGKFLAWLAIPQGSTWLDVGCGTGALTQAILQEAAPWLVKGIDSAQGYISFVSARITDRRASFENGDAQELPVEDGAYDAVVSGLVLNFLPYPQRALEEMKRAAEPGGTVAVYVWDYAGRMQFMRHFWNAVVFLDPEAANLDEGRRFPLCKPDALESLFQAAGLKDVKVQPIDTWTVFKDFEDYWQPFLGGQGPAPGYVASLSQQHQERLREHIRQALPNALDGSIPLIARAWAARGTA